MELAQALPAERTRSPAGGAETAARTNLRAVRAVVYAAALSETPAPRACSFARPRGDLHTAIDLQAPLLHPILMSVRPDTALQMATKHAQLELLETLTRTLNPSLPHTTQSACPREWACGRLRLADDASEQ